MKKSNNLFSKKYEELRDGYCVYLEKDKRTGKIEPHKGKCVTLGSGHRVVYCEPYTFSGDPSDYETLGYNQQLKRGYRKSNKKCY